MHDSQRQPRLQWTHQAMALLLDGWLSVWSRSCKEMITAEMHGGILCRDSRDRLGERGRRERERREVRKLSQARM